MKKATKKAATSTDVVNVEDKKNSNINKADDIQVQEDKFTEEVIQDIYKNIKNDKICLYYACIGHDFSSGKPIYDYNILVDLLINYGYTIKYILEFIDQFVNSEFYPNGEKPCIITDRFRDELYSCVEPLKSNVCKKLRKQQ